MERSRSSKSIFQDMRGTDRELAAAIATLRNTDRSLPTWVAPVLLNAWENFGGDEDTAAFWRSTGGMVLIKGVVRLGPIPSIVFVLPEGFRPSTPKRFPVVSNDAFGYVNVDENGSLSVIVGNNAWVDLSPIIFRAEG